MKTFFEKIFIHFDSFTHPADSGWSKVSTAQSKKKSARHIPQTSLSPECYNVRGSSKKTGDVRRTPAP